ncbi:MAG: NUDIX hydrolase [Actinomycetota bacterium]
MVFRPWSSGSIALSPAEGDLAQAVNQIEAAILEGPAQHQARDRILDFVAEHPDALHRSCLSGHLTGSGIVVDPATGRSLLIHHAKLGRWLQPGGHADGDGNLASVAWREATEETGLGDLRVVTPAIDVDIHRIPARPGEPEHLHLDLRHLILVGDDREAAPNHETLGARWMAPDDPEIAGTDELHRAVSRACALARDRFAA